MTLVEEPQVIAGLVRIKDHLLLFPVSWATYEALLEQCADRRLRHTYDRGRLEFMTPSSEHEVYKSLLGLFVVTLADEWNLPLYLGGELTLRKQDLDRGLEPDQCFWLANEPKVRGKTQLDFNQDPPPDLFIEIEVTRTVVNRLEVLAALEVPEVWRFDGTELGVGVLQANREYQWSSRSPNFPALDMAELVRFLLLARTTDHLSVVRAFRTWVREQKR